MAQSAAWHSSGVKGPLALDAPVGIPLSEILDHLVLARAAGRGVLVGSWKACEIMLLMWGVAACSVEREEGGAPVMTRLPLAVQCAAATFAIVGEIAESLEFRVSHTSSGRGRSSGASLRVARLTTTLEMLGLDAAAAE